MKYIEIFIINYKISKIKYLKNYVKLIKKKIDNKKNIFQREF